MRSKREVLEKDADQRGEGLYDSVPDAGNHYDEVDLDKVITGPDVSKQPVERIKDKSSSKTPKPKEHASALTEDDEAP